MTRTKRVLFCNPKKGISLTELIVASTLLLVVLALGYHAFFYGAGVFAAGEARSIVQRDIRRAADTITKEFRNATITGFPLNSDQVVVDHEHRYLIFFDRTIKIMNEDGKVIYTTENTIDSITYSFSQVTLKRKTNSLFQFRIDGSKNGILYHVPSGVLMNNENQQAISPTTQNNLWIVKYKKISF